MNILSKQPIKWHWCAVIFLLPIAFGIGALRHLTQSPTDTDCSSGSLSNQEAASVFYCANMLASAQEVEKLLQAIQLVNNLPQHHPLRQEKLLEKWSLEILQHCENATQAGELSKAVDMANMIPTNISTYKIVLKRIQKWKAIWSQAEAINQAAKEIISKDEKESWHLAIMKAKELRKLDNQYWANTKYQELVYYIQDVTEKTEKIKLAEAEIAKSIAQKEIELMQKFQVVQEPDFMQKLQDKQAAEDSKKLNKARMLARSGRIEDWEAAIDEANLIISEAKYEEAQNLISNIKSKIEILEDNSYLQEAKKLALKNDELSLQLAISRASLISDDSQVYKEVNKNIVQWKQRLLQLSSQKLQTEPKVTPGSKKTMSDNNFDLTNLENENLNRINNSESLLESNTDN